MFKKVRNGKLVGGGSKKGTEGWVGEREEGVRQANGGNPSSLGPSQLGGGPGSLLKAFLGRDRKIQVAHVALKGKCVGTERQAQKKLRDDVTFQRQKGWGGGRRL